MQGTHTPLGRVPEGQFSTQLPALSWNCVMQVVQLRTVPNSEQVLQGRGQRLHTRESG